MANELPFTRFTHAACHVAPAEVPTMAGKFDSVNDSLKKETANFKDNPRHTAPQLKDIASSLYPFINRGPVDVRGGHHDAGDYSKYTINSAAFYPSPGLFGRRFSRREGFGQPRVARKRRWQK